MANQEFQASTADLNYLLSTRAVRERSLKVFELCKQGGTHFSFDESKMPAIADLVAKVTRENYPALNVPFHSRWKHFQAGGIDRNTQFNKQISSLSPLDQARTKIDLVVVSVLLDAGAGDVWKFTEAETGKSVGRSEGLAVASLELFKQGRLSSDSKNLYQADAKGIAQLSFEDFSRVFQISAVNPLAGAEGRFELIKTLGRVIASNTKHFGGMPARIGNLLDYLQATFPAKQLLAQDILRALQDSLGDIWPGRVTLRTPNKSCNLGDAWPYIPFGKGLESIVPFHKLSLWLTYSLVDPLIEAGFEVQGFDALSGLPEYRNGGLFVDMDVLQLRNLEDLKRAHAPSSGLIVEWRALTICLLDQLAPLVRKRLGVDEKQMPLGKVLEGGTWAAGRIVAAEKRKGGGSPIELESDGTVF